MSKFIKTKNIPKLRFPEFSGEWEEKRLSDVSEPPSYGMNAAAKSFDGTNIYLRITDIDEYSHKLVKSNLTSPSGKLTDEYLLYENDLVFARTGASTGKTYIYDSQDGRMYFAGFLIKFSISNANSKFVYYNTLLNKYHKWVKTASMRSGQPGINAKEYASYKIFFPEIMEQQKIASFLSSVDEWIENLKKQKDELEKYKKGMMQKIFSQEIRFKDDSGNDFPDWVEKKLGHIADFSKGEGVSKADVTPNGKYKCIRYGELYTTYKEKISRVKSRTNIQGKKLSQPNDILMPTSDVTPYGLATASALDEEGVILGGDILVIRSKELNNLFFSYYIGANKKDVMRLVNGVTVYHLYGSDLGNMTIKIPSLIEQQKIAEFLTSLDDLIQSKQQKISQAESWKKGLMQNMFV